MSFGDASSVLGYLEPRERVWWLQMSFFCARRS